MTTGGFLRIPAKWCGNTRRQNSNKESFTHSLETYGCCYYRNQTDYFLHKVEREQKQWFCRNSRMAHKQEWEGRQVVIRARKHKIEHNQSKRETKAKNNELPGRNVPGRYLEQVKECGRHLQGRWGWWEGVCNGYVKEMTGRDRRECGGWVETDTVLYMLKDLRVYYSCGEVQGLGHNCAEQNAKLPQIPVD